ncbi:oxidoreductase [Paenibacillus sp. 32O-W]|uniref:PhzF family phenazine biosynthesis protein n=1 Tax=Paenibacillus sp. 32O-W TaxID=1695218 RepID=UPI0007227C11|nr:PhzF family phenazine biosynthesis protein [Paenibacillus sp. 32O-W]ALS28515.1 oxidoreductase [Paenibacillus sp. 32O-W]
MNNGTIHIIDAFTAEPFKGNPAAVCFTEKPLDDERMQLIAAEMNLSETAFLVPAGDHYSLRWFMPKAEVELCGHATLAAAHFLWETGQLDGKEAARFSTLSGMLTAVRDGKGIMLDFPSEPVTPDKAPDELIEALGLIPRFTGRNRMDYLIEVESERAVRELKPDSALLSALTARGVVVTARADAGTGYDFVSRAFYPALGVPEDPVTGSAHCALTPYWSKRLRRTEMTAYQASSRGGFLRVIDAGERVKLIGEAVTVLKGELALGAGRN